MFCQNCGTKNEDGSLFCENCGAKLEVAVSVKAPLTGEAPVTPNTPVTGSVAPKLPNDTFEEEKPKKSFKINVLMLVAAVEAVLVIFAAVFLFKAVKEANNFEKTASSFWNYMAAGEFDKAYRYFDLDEDSVLTEESFVSAMKTQPYAEAKKVSVRKARQKTDEATYIIKYEYNEKEYELELSLELSGKEGLFGGDWTVSTAPFINRDIAVTVPRGAKLILDGKEVSDSFATSETQYTIPKVFVGYHTYYAESGILTSEKQVTKENYVYCSNLTLVEDEKKKLVSVAEETTEKLVDAMLNAADYEKVSKYFTTNRGNSSTRLNADSYADYTDRFFNGASLNWSNRICGITSMDLSDMKVSIGNVSVSDDGIPTVQVSIRGNLEFDYKEYNPDKKLMEKETTYTNSDFYCYVEFDYENDNWIATDITDFSAITSPSYYNY